MELQLQHQSFQMNIWSQSDTTERLNWNELNWSPKHSQESSPAPHFKSINSWVLSLCMVQVSHLYLTTGKTIALTRWISVGKVVSFLFSTLSRFVMAFFQGASIFSFYDCSHHPKWFWSPSPPLKWQGSKESTCQCRRHKRGGFNPPVGKMPWRRNQQPSEPVKVLSCVWLFATLWTVAYQAPATHSSIIAWNIPWTE